MFTHPILEAIKEETIQLIAMAVSTEINPKEMIKPSSPTPPHLRKLHLSLLDQIAPPSYFHIIFYFSPSDHLTLDSTEKSKALKRSLSDALAVYYPLAGRLRDDHSVECNDAGVEYSEATFSDERINDAMEKIEERTQYVPIAPSGGGDIPLAIQTSFFSCSGMAIGVCVWHKVADAKSILDFVNIWATICRGDSPIPEAVSPSFEMASRFPATEYPGFFSEPDENVVTKRIVFGAEKIEELKAAASGPLMEKPSSVEAVSAFIWSRLIEAARKRDKINGGEAIDRCFAALHVVDLRGRASPPLPPHSFGNGTVNVVAMMEGKERDCYSLAMKLREEFRKVDGDYVRKFEDGSIFAVKHDESEKEENDVAVGKEKVMELCLFSSWWRLPAFEADFGWGKPAGVTTMVAAPVKNLITFMGTKSGDGIEAWINLGRDEVAFVDLGF